MHHLTSFHRVASGARTIAALAAFVFLLMLMGTPTTGQQNLAPSKWGAADQRGQRSECRGHINASDQYVQKRSSGILR